MPRSGRSAVVAVLMALLLSLSMSAAVQGATPGKVVKVNPLGFLLRVYNASYETVLAPNRSLEFTGSYVSWNLGLFSVSSVGVGGGVRFYLREEAPQGFYVGPQVGAALATVSSASGGQGNGVTFAGSGVAGYQWITGGGFTFDLQALLSYSFGSVEVGGDPVNVGGLAPGFGFSMGYAW